MRNEHIWRYLDFTKFVDLLSTSSLFFCRADRFEDPFEGSVPKKHYEKQIQQFELQPSLFDNERELNEKYGEEYRTYVYINCWHSNQSESAALWRLYLQSHEGVAIKSTRSNMTHSLSESQHSIWSVPVKYIDYENDDIVVPSNMAPYRFKRKSFEYEKELRAIIYADVTDEKGKKNEPLSESGINISCDINELIEYVTVSPTSPLWFLELVKNIVKTYGYKFPVVRSAIVINKPVFI